jgi:hypothetical protein
MITDKRIMEKIFIRFGLLRERSINHIRISKLGLSVYECNYEVTLKRIALSYHIN